MTLASGKVYVDIRGFLGDEAANDSEVIDMKLNYRLETGCQQCISL